MLFRNKFVLIKFVNLLTYGMLMIKSIFMTLFTLLLLSACSERISTTESLMSHPTEITISSLDDLDSVFQSFDYTHENWDKGSKEVPRLTFESVNPKWQEVSKKMPIENKKSIFLRLMLPLVLVSNENILHERSIVEHAELTSPDLLKIAIKYSVVGATNTVLTEQDKVELLKRVNTIPPSLALAQAVEESAWGTSRFAVEGNSLFGQWDFGPNSIKPKRQRKGLGDYGIARFDNPLASVEGYMLNINTTSAYQAFRSLRAQQVEKEEKYSGFLMAGTLVKYSERGEAYIAGLRSLISYNKLDAVDESYLADNNLVHLVY